MKKLSLLALAALVVIISAVALLLPASAEGGNVIYIADVAQGTGDGSSAANAMGNDAAYQAALDAGDGVYAAATGSYSTSLYKGSALWKAVDALKTSGGLIVICGDTTVSFGDNSAASTNYRLPSHTANVTISAKNGAEDYTASASLITKNNGQKIRFNMTGPTTFDNLTIKRNYSGSNKDLFLIASGKKLVIGENVSIVADTGIAKDVAAFPTLVGGTMYGKVGKNAEGVSVDMTVLSGEYYQVLCTNQFPNDTGEIAGDVNVTLGNVIVNNALYVACTSSVSAAKPGNIMGDVNITLDGATMKNLIYLSGCVSNNDETKACGAVKGNITLTVKGATTLVKEIYLGYGASLTKYDPANPENGGKTTVKFVGNEWAMTKASYGFLYWGGSGSNAPKNYSYSVMDFSGMTREQFDAKTFNANNNSSATDKPISQGYPIRDISVPGTSSSAAPNYGVDEVILPALWIADVATGDGSGNDEFNAMGASETFLSTDFSTLPNTTIYKESALVKAFAQLKSTGGLIKFAGDVSIGFGDTDGNASNINLFGDNNSSNKAIYVDGNGHKLKIEVPEKVTANRVMVRCPSYWDNIEFAVNFRAALSNLTAVKLYNEGRGVNFGFNGNRTVIGENVTCTTNVTDSTAVTFAYPSLVASNMWGNLAKVSTRGTRGLQIGEGANLTVLGGTWSDVYMSGQFPSADNSNLNGTDTLYLKNATVKYSIYGCYTRSPFANAGGIKGDVSVTLDHATVANVMMTSPWGSSSTTPKESWATIVGNVDFVVKNGSQLTGITYFTPTANASSWDASYNYGTISGNVTVTIDGTGTGDPVKFNRFDLGGRGLGSESNLFTLKFLGDNWSCTNTSATPIIAYMGSGSNFYGAYRKAAVDFSGMTFEQFINKKIGTANVSLLQGFFRNGANADFTVNGIVYGKKSPDASPYGFNTVVYPQGGVVVDGSTLTVETDLTLKVLARTNLDISNLSMTITDDKGTIENVPGTVSGSSVVFPVSGINAQRMGDGFDLVLYNGDKVIFEKQGFTVREFALNAYNSSAEALGIDQGKYDSLIALLASTLNYGAEAQKYAKYRLASLVNEGEDIAGLMAYAVSDDPTTFANAKNVGASSETDTKFSAATVYLANNVDFVIKFRTDDTEGLSFVMMDGDTVVADLPVEDMMPDLDGRFSVIPGTKLKASELGKVFTFKLVRNSVEIQNLEYSIGSYLTNMAFDSKVGALVNSLTNYGVAAMAYAEA